MDGFDNSPRQDNMSLKRRSWEIDQAESIRSQQIAINSINTTTSLVASSINPNPNPYYNFQDSTVALIDQGHGDLVSLVVPPAVTVVLEGRSICHRISLHKHSSYQSLAKALRQMFSDIEIQNNNEISGGDNLDLSNAIPGHLIAYEDIENDLLLVGDLNWKDFVRVAKRIRIMPVKSNSRKPKSEVI